MLAHPIFDLVCAFYGILGAGAARYLWNCRTPIDASIRALRIPKYDTFETPADDIAGLV